MFKNVSDKIMITAQVIFEVGVFLLILCGIFLDLPLINKIVLVVAGIASAWIVSIILYGLGELLENSKAIRRELEMMASYNETKETPKEER